MVDIFLHKFFKWLYFYFKNNVFGVDCMKYRKEQIKLNHELILNIADKLFVKLLWVIWRYL